MGQTGVQDIVFVSGKACEMIVTVGGLSCAIGFSSIPARAPSVIVYASFMFFFFPSPFWPHLNVKQSLFFPLPLKELA